MRMLFAGMCLWRGGSMGAGVNRRAAVSVFMTPSGRRWLGMSTSSYPRSCVCRSGAQPGCLRDESAGSSPGYPKACPQPYPHDQALRTARRDRVVAVGCAACPKTAEAASRTGGARRPNYLADAEAPEMHRRSWWRACESVLHTRPLTQRGRARSCNLLVMRPHRRASEST
jgi:hypothetical protein